MSEPVISIICNTYNQKKYIADALESFLMQRVNVPFEILVHDDASTDGTADVIREYEAKYPDIIKPIYQIENQFRKEGLITYRFQIPRAKGKYIAFCEGDDYWTDPDKLKIQYEYMEEHPEYSACCHAYDMVDLSRNIIQHCDIADKNKVFYLSSFLNNQLEVPQLATFFVKKEIFNGFSGIYLGHRANDMVFRIYCAVKGLVYYFNRNMSAYRRFVEGSWTMRVGQDSIAMARNLEGYIPFLERLDKETNYKYSKEINFAIDSRRYQAAWLKHDYNMARKCKCFSEENIAKKLAIVVGCICPKLINKIRKLKI